MITFKHVTKRYENGSDALRSINFSLPQGELAFLTGHSGAGKSTLLRLINLNERATRGDVKVHNVSLSSVKGRRIALFRRTIGVVYQNHRLINDRSVFDNVALPLILTGVDAKEIQRRVRGALDKVGLLKKEASYPLSLSGGEQQRVGIARAVIHRPKILLADEPTGNLDPGLSKEIMDIFSLFHRYNTTVLIATHDLSMINRHGAHVLNLHEGRLES